MAPFSQGCTLGCGITPLRGYEGSTPLLGIDLDLAAADVKLARLAELVVVVRFAGLLIVRRQRLLLVDLLGTFDGLPGVVDQFGGGQRRLAVEIGIGEQPRGGAGVVEDVEEQFPVILAHTSATADDLLKLGHRADDADEHHVLARRSVDAGGQKLRCGEDHRCAFFRILKPAQEAVCGP
jgi:hypothetical protein